MRLRAWLLRPIHISWHIAWASTGVVVGTVLSGGLAHDNALLCVGAACLCLVAIKKIAWLAAIALVAGLCIGMWRGSGEQAERATYKPFFGQEISVRGTVNEDPAIGPRGDQRILLASSLVGNHPAQGTVWLSLPLPLDVRRGDHITAEGKLGEGFGGVAASMHRARLTVIERPTPPSPANAARNAFDTGARSSIKEPEAGLGVGFLTGQRSSLPDELETQLRVLGLTHIVVASGYNLTVLVGLARKLLANTSKYLATLVSSLLIASFMAITGLSPSMGRAGLVAGLGLAAWYYGRTLHPLVLLPFAAAVTVMVNPAYARGDLGWYLSFASFAGVLVLAPLLHHYFWGQDKKPSVAQQTLLDTLSAQIATFPLLAFVFGTYSLLALPANMIILPFVPLAMLLTFVGGLSGMVIPAIAELAGMPAQLVLGAMVWVVGRLGSLPYAQGELSFGPRQLAGCYLLLIAAMWFLWLKTRHDFRKK